MWHNLEFMLDYGINSPCEVLPDIRKRLNQSCNMSVLAWRNLLSTYHDNTDPSSLRCIEDVLPIDTARDRSCSVIVKIKMQQAVSSSEFQILQK